MTGAEQEAVLAGIRKSWEAVKKRQAARQKWWVRREAIRLRRWAKAQKGANRAKEKDAG